MPIGSILRHFVTIELGAADGKRYRIRNTPLTRIGLALIGLPHLGFRARARIIFRFLQCASDSARILDAGSGYGIYALTLADRGYRVDAIDIMEERTEALAACKREVPKLDARISAITGTIVQLPFADDSYDVIVCSDVIEHIEDDTKAVAELARVLRPGGLLILTVPYDSKNNRKIYTMFGHERPGYTKNDMQRIIAPLHLYIEETACYEYALGNVLFKMLNAVSLAPLVALLFYPLYLLYLLDMQLKIGEPNGIGFKISKR